MAKSVEGDANTGFSDQATVENGNTATWKLALNNTLSTVVDKPVIFDDFSKINGDSKFTTSLRGPVIVSEGATVSYSKDATASNNGSWNTDWKDAISFKVTKEKLNIGEKIEVLVPVITPSDTKKVMLQ
ncbi:hypothetical protein FM106_03690 [Brachybacterium faecium]|nr:hypothetical protein FM106_03690 [Brachybacterium faecium]